MTNETLKQEAQEHTDAYVATQKDKGCRIEYSSHVDNAFEAGARMMLKRVMQKCDENWYAATANDLRNMLYEEYKQLLP